MKPIWPLAPMPHKPVVVGDTLVSRSLTPPAMALVWQGPGGRLVMGVKFRQSGHRGGFGSGGSVDVGARLDLSPGL